jgi:hypothetical protein
VIVNYYHEQLKGIYDTIERFCEGSGLHWDDINGAAIQGEAATAVFDTFVAQVCCFSLL